MGGGSSFLVGNSRRQEISAALKIPESEISMDGFQFFNDGSVAIGDPLCPAPYKAKLITDKVALFIGAYNQGSQNQKFPKDFGPTAFFFLNQVIPFIERQENMWGLSTIQRFVSALSGDKILTVSEQYRLLAQTAKKVGIVLNQREPAEELLRTISRQTNNEKLKKEIANEIVDLCAKTSVVPTAAIKVKGPDLGIGG